MVEEKKRKECKKCGDELVIDECPKLKVNGREVGIADLDNIMNEVIALNLSDEGQIGKELLQRVKDRDFVPPSVEKEYSQALLEEYKDRI